MRPKDWNFNPRSPHGERLNRRNHVDAALVISTHAPRTGSDGDQYATVSYVDEFQPTLPARGATVTRCRVKIGL